MEILVSEQSDFQHIMVYRAKSMPELILDGYPQSTLPNNEYYELLLGKTRESVLVLGGGDLTGVEVFCSEKVRDWKLVEIDEKVIEVCSRFTRRRRKLWQNNVIIGDALTYLQECEPVDHIIIDLLAMTRFDVLAAPYSFTEFIQLLQKKARKHVSGFVSTGNYGTAAGIVMLPVLKRAGFAQVELLINELGENFFWATQPGHESGIRDDMKRYVVHYGAGLTNEAIFDLQVDEQLIIVDEAL